MRCLLNEIDCLPEDVSFLFSDENKSSAELFRELFRRTNERTTVLYRPNGQPYGIKEGETFPLSASHNKNFTVVCAKSKGYVGVDVQTEVLWSREKQEIAFSDREIASAENRPLRLDFLWAAKESLLKSIGIGLEKGYRYVEVLTDYVTYCDVSFKGGEENNFLHPAFFRIPLEKASCLIFTSDCATIKK